METDLIITKINDIQKIANDAFQKKDIKASSSVFADTLKYTDISGTTLSKKELVLQLEKLFGNAKQINKEYYRVKSHFEADVFIEKVAAKIVLIKPLLGIFSKKQTIQTEEIFHWSEINGDWRITEGTLMLEEKY